MTVKKVSQKKNGALLIFNTKEVHYKLGLYVKPWLKGKAKKMQKGRSASWKALLPLGKIDRS